MTPVEGMKGCVGGVGSVGGADRTFEGQLSLETRSLFIGFGDLSNFQGDGPGVV